MIGLRRWASTPWLLVTFLIGSPTFAQQPLLQITSPASNALVSEGQSLTITVSADPSVQDIYVVVQSPLPEVQPTSNPTQFTLTLPTNITPGLYQIAAMGDNSSGDIESAPVLIDVERSDAPVSVVVQPTFFSIQGIGAQTPIPIYGIYADGTNLYLSNSTQTVLVSNNTAIATVSGATPSSPRTAAATAVGGGETSVVVSTYPTGSTTASATATIWVTVIVPPPGPAPVITSVSTNKGIPGVTQVTVKGSNFGSAQGSGYLELGNRSATSISLWTQTQIVATVPLGSMSGVVLVKQNGVASNSFPFTTATPSITEINPPSGGAGTPITIKGANFGETQNGSRVMFNQSAATPTSWANGLIVAPVPASATTGTIVVFVNDAYSNAASFTVPAPVINSLNPDRGGVGATVTIKGSNFGASASTGTVTFNGIAATPSTWGETSITVQVPTAATSGAVVVTVNGVASNGATFLVNNTSDFTGTLKVPAIGTTSPPTQVPTSGNLSAGQNASLTFSGTAGQIVSFNFLNSTIGSTSSNCTATLYDSLNNNIGTGSCGAQAAGWMGPIPLISKGMYRLYLVPNGGATGSVSVSVNNDSDVTTPAISIGGSAVTTKTISGQDVRLSFAAASAQHIGVSASNVTNPSATLYVLSSSGLELAFTQISSGSQTFFVDAQLPATGTYQLVIQHSSTNSGSETLQIVGTANDFPGSLTVPTTPGTTGPLTQVPTTGTLSRGQNASLSFSGVAGQKLSFNVVGSTIGTSSTSCQVSIDDPNGNPIAFPGNCGVGANYVDTVTLPSTEAYTFHIVPQGGATGSVGISVNNAQDVTTPPIMVGGSAVTTTMLVPGQDVRLSFTTTGRQHILVSATNVTNPSAFLSVLDSSGSPLGSANISNNPAGKTFTIDLQLRAAGTYQLLVQHLSSGIGSETLQIVGGPADFTGTLTVPAPGTTGPIKQVPTTGSLAPMQNASLTFFGSAGQKLSFNLLSSTITSCMVTIYDPNHNVVPFNCYLGSNYVDTIILSSTGAYTLYIAPPAGITAGSVSVSVNNAQDVTTPGITIGGGAVTTTTQVPGQDVFLSFFSTVAQHVVITATNVAYPYATVDVLGPSDSTQAYLQVNNNPTGQIFTTDLWLAGSQMYRLWVRHGSPVSSSVTLQIASATPDFTGTLTVPAPGTTGPVTQVPNLAPAQNAFLAFYGTAGQKLSFNELNSTIGISSTSCQVTISDSQNSLIPPDQIAGYCGIGASFVDTVTLPSTTTYELVINPQDLKPGSVDISVNNDADVTTPAITIGGSAVTATTLVPGQDVRLSFQATAPQHIAVTTTNVTNPAAVLEVLSPSGSVLASEGINNLPGQTFFLDTQLSVGTYQLWIYHGYDSPNFGSETLQITVVSPDFTGPLTVPSQGTTGPVTQVPTTGNLAEGQNASLTFSGTAGQQLSFNVLNSTIGETPYYCVVTIYDPTHTSIAQGSCGAGASLVGPVTLPVTSNAYTFYIDPNFDYTGSVGISVNNLP